MTYAPPAPPSRRLYEEDDDVQWLPPWILAGTAVAGGLGVGFAALRWRGQRDEEPAADGPELDPEDRRRLDADLARFDR